MKRLWSTPEFLAGQRIRARKRERRFRVSQGSHFTRTERSRPRARQDHQPLIAPERLDLFRESDDTIGYFNSLRQALQKQGARVFLDLSKVENFTSDSLLVLRAMMDGTSRAPDTRVSGNLPLDPVVAAEFKASGFFSGFAKPPENLPPPKGLMKKKSDLVVYATIAADLVDFASRQATVARGCANASSQNLIEAMTNTHNHAGRRKGGQRARKKRHERWWASVYCRDNVAYFSFVDLGVGILKSAPAKGFLRKLQKSGALPASAAGRIKLLRQAFQGVLGSATGKPGRGLGLPRMKKDADEKRLLDLRVLTSDVLGSVIDLDFRSARHSLQGTAFRWQTGHKRSG